MKPSSKAVRLRTDVFNNSGCLFLFFNGARENGSGLQERKLSVKTVSSRMEAVPEHGTFEN